MYDGQRVKANKLYYLGRGLCPLCGGKRPVEPGRRACKVCQEKNLARNRARRAVFAQEGRCLTCGAALPDKRYKSCEVCQMRVKRWQMEHR